MKLLCELTAVGSRIALSVSRFDAIVTRASLGTPIMNSREPSKRMRHLSLLVLPAIGLGLLLLNPSGSPEAQAPRETIAINWYGECRLHPWEDLGRGRTYDHLWLPHAKRRPGAYVGVGDGLWEAD